MPVIAYARQRGHVIQGGGASDLPCRCRDARRLELLPAAEAGVRTIDRETETEGGREVARSPHPRRRRGHGSSDF
ncbi:hypothetical protein NDU88_006142 [Pleurodeles waltl]|uniref:Uncharacterized protein n=1 Tax=Pleurodeles waltl TaxID=8319 RepID=A0AAV7RKP1_PLEWA|nr:hypothetical protein NDU88_006142 [Pleurodeles waltl]